MRRSRAAANRLAEELLQRRQCVTGDQVLAVLRRWYFKSSNVRTNVIPEGLDGVKSETLGLVRSRDGRLLTARNTLKHTSVFTLLCKWLRNNQPNNVTFPFTSISVNYEYGAKIHRDANNAGPSMTRAFGEFTGGQLLYWKDDDAELPVDKLVLNDAISLDSHSSLVLFDGLRAHAVARFTGERYSLVFFCISQYARAPPMAVETLVGCGAEWPTVQTVAHYAKLLGPPKGYTAPSHSILRFFGSRAENDQALAWPSKKLVTLGDDLLSSALSYVLRPSDMSALCAVCRGFSAAAWRPAAWHESTIHTAGMMPSGRLARRHYTLWISARLIIGGRWQFGNVGLLTSKTFAVWRWAEKDGSHFLPVASKTVMVSQSSVVCTAATMIFDDIHVEGDVTVGLTCSRNLAVIVLGGRKGACPRYCRATFTRRGLLRRASLRGPLTFTCRGEGGVRLKGPVRVGRPHYVVVVFDQEAPPRGSIVPCWTKL